MIDKEFILGDGCLEWERAILNMPIIEGVFQFRHGSLNGVWKKKNKK